MRPSIATVVFTLLLGLAGATFAATDVYEFDTEEQRERFKRFTYELRCPKCQSQNLAGSDSMISQDLKRELHNLIQQGKTDEEVVDFMVSRYGDFVLYKPKFQANTYLLWLGPAALIFVGLGVFGWVLYKRQPPEIE
ncbi:cytochrome c-type biogenesis protein [Gilvimarinus sp. F26214L]|uniref:cytochrome c-type biogenesis protein n=1 Tax=Gilvimarinus sp. DZF01 TaxID=3461371 RepID=UPI0040462D92